MSIPFAREHFRGVPLDVTYALSPIEEDISFSDKDDDFYSFDIVVIPSNNPEGEEFGKTQTYKRIDAKSFEEVIRQAKDYVNNWSKVSGCLSYAYSKWQPDKISEILSIFGEINNKGNVIRQITF